MTDAPETIYLIPGKYNGQLATVWRDDPQYVGLGGPNEVVRYVRADRLAEVERERDSLSVELEGCKQANEMLHQDKRELAAMVGRLREALWQAADRFETEFSDLAGEADCRLACNETPEQSLAEIKADAVKEGMRKYAQQIREGKV